MFRGARLKLTAWYLLIIMLISISFSVVIYRVLMSEVERLSQAQRLRFERQLHEGGIFLFPFSVMDPDLVNETKHRLMLILFLVDGGIFVISGGLGYFLAGRTLRPIQDMLDEQNRFISDSSHELRTPLTSLKSAMEVNLRDKELSIKDARSLIAENILEVDKLQSLSDQLLQLSQYQKPDGYAKFEKVDLAQIIKESVHKIEPLAKKKMIKIEIKTEELIIEGNKYGLSDLLIILLDNAVKYSPEKKEIKVSLSKVDSHAQISVKDQGIGIEDKDLPHIFDRFYRADTARLKPESGGYGLGLSIAKKIAEIHHGSISVESKSGRGSNFIVHLPSKQSVHITESHVFS